LAKSATAISQTGNPQPRTWHDTDTNGASLNSEGLPNLGIGYYLDAKTIEEAMGSSEKPYMVSISGNTLEDNLTMLQQILKSPQKIAAIELNLACPNIIGKPIIGYDFDQMKSVLEQVSKVKNISKLPLGVKLPPYFDGPHFQQAATILNNYAHVVKYVASINTIGNALAVDAISEAPVISAKGGFAGLSGRAVKYTALSNVRQMRSLLDDEIDVVGVGGIETGSDAFEMILCGAHAVQVGTCHWKEGPKCFDRICTELRELMASKGYDSIEDFRGKLKPYSKEGATLSRAARKNDSSSEIKTTTAESTRDHFMTISAILAVLVAILLADKFGLVNIG
jgi:dihydroorotate dehydrogenase (fumarate)